MSDTEPSPELVDRLISAAQRIADAPDPEPPARDRRSTVLTVIGVVLIVGGVATWLLSRNNSEPAAAPDTTTVAQSVPAADATVVSDPAATDPVVTEPVATEPVVTEPVATEPVATDPATTDPAATDPVAANPGDDTPIRYAEFSGGKVYLRGTVPDQATADEVTAKAAAVVGEANVVVEYRIVPGSPVPNDAPLYVRDSILFAPGSTRLNPAATAVLDLGVLLFSQNPQMTMVVEGHTDSGGSFEDNLVLSQARVDAILAYFESKGVDASRVTGVAKGESEPQATNDTADGRALNRRVEAQIIDLLG